MLGFIAEGDTTEVEPPLLYCIMLIRLSRQWCILTNSNCIFTMTVYSKVSTQLFLKQRVSDRVSVCVSVCAVVGLAAAADAATAADLSL